jgi:hypothetical protein
MVRFIIGFSVIVSMCCTSCSRQFTIISTTSHFQGVSGPVTRHTLIIGSEDESQTTKNQLVIASQALTPGYITKPEPAKHTGGKRKVIFNGQLIKSTTSIYLAKINNATNLGLSEKHTLSAYPQINKAGFILIGAAILGYFLHLILAAVIILLVLGLIILLAPLFRRRY